MILKSQNLVFYQMPIQMGYGHQAGRKKMSNERMQLYEHLSRIDLN